MAFNALDELREAGIVTSGSSQPALDILGELSEDEAKFLISLNARIKAVTAPEVVAHSEEGEEETPCAGVLICSGTYSSVEL